MSIYTSWRFATAESLNTGGLNSCSANASLRSANSCSKSLCDGDSEFLSDASSSRVSIVEHGRLYNFL